MEGGVDIIRELEDVLGGVGYAEAPNAGQVAKQCRGVPDRGAFILSGWGAGWRNVGVGGPVVVSRNVTGRVDTQPALHLA